MNMTGRMAFLVSAFACSIPAAPTAAQSTPWFTQVTSSAGLSGLIGFRLSVADVNG